MAVPEKFTAFVNGAPVATLSGTEVIPAVVGATTKSTTPNALKTFIGSGALLWPTLTPPLDNTFGWINQLGATSSQNASAPAGVYLQSPAINGGQNVIARWQNTPATPYHVEAMFLPSFMENDYAYGMVFAESGTGKLVTFLFQQVNSPPKMQINVYKHSSPTVAVAPYSGFPQTTLQMIHWMRIGDDGTNLTFDLSPDGLNWWNAFTIPRTDYLASGPNQIGYFVYPSNTVSGSYPMALTCVHWKVTA